MNRRAATTLWGVCLALVTAMAVSGCDRGAATTGTAPQPAADGIVTSIDVVPVTPLLPRLATHYTLDTRGNLYWIQESEHPEAGGDLVFAMGDSGVPQSVPELAASRILMAAGHPKGTGAVRSIAAGPEDNLYVYFAGGDGRQALALLLRYVPRTHAVTVVADAAQLMGASGLADSIDLARGTLVSGGSDVWLWLRSELLGASSALLKVTPGSAGAVELRRLVYQSSEPSMRRKPLVLDSEREDLSAGAGGSVYYLDRRRACLWRIDGSGAATRLQSLEGLSQSLSGTSVDDEGRITLLAGESADGLFAREGASSPAEWAQLHYPAIVRIEPDGKVRTIGGNDVHGPPGFPLNTLEPRGLVADRAHGGWVTFDGASGELVQVKLGRR